jgi:predicted ATPase/DNA-binding winged helix-turn-helix (wHTH) protein
MLSEIVRPVYTSGECEIDLARRELRILGSLVPVGGRAFEIIEVLAQSAGELVSKDELMDRIWPGAIIMENTLHVHAAAVRKALGPHRGLLKTVSGRGYRLLGDWSIRRQDAATPPVGLQKIRTSGEVPGSNFPLTVTRLVGRSAAVQRVQDLVSAYRVVTLTGPGGIGKTSLALKVGRRILGEFGDGGWLIELASLSDPELVPSTVGSTLGLKFSGEISAESVARAVGGANLLLVLDNCEHVVGAVATMAEMFVRLCPRTTILATSREVLRIEGEHVYRVPPLDVPALGQETPADMLSHSAVELFIARTTAMDADRAPRDEDLALVGAICRRLDGIPLAIEFAAASAATLGIAQVALGLRDRFALLTGGRRTALARQRTLRATLDWSHELLPEPERWLFRRLAVFQGGFTLDAAIAVMADTGLDAAMVTHGVASLVAKSLVALDTSRGTTRWYMLETIRAYALEKLAKHGETDSVSGRHAKFFRDLIGSMTPTWGLGSRSPVSVDGLREIGNARAALDWAFSTEGDPEIGIALTAAYIPIWFGASLLAECRDRTEHSLRCLEPTTSPLLHMRLQLGLGIALIVTSGPVERSRQSLSEARREAESLGDLDAQLRALWGLWTLCLNTGECYEAKDLAERFLAVGLRSGNDAILPVAHRILGHSLHLRGNQMDARHHLERVFKLSDRSTARYSTWLLYDEDILAGAMLARVMWLQGFPEQALSAAQMSMTKALATDDKLTLCLVLVLALIPIALNAGERATAERAWTMLSETATRNNFRQYTRLGHGYEGMLLISRREFEAGTALLKAALENDGRGRGTNYSSPAYLAVLAHGLAELGQLDEAQSAIDRALDGAQGGGLSWCLAELLRTKGELLVRQGVESFASAEAHFRDALGIARQQGALFWELRIALSLARLRASQGSHHEARNILAPVYNRFTEGFATADMQAARALLDSR